MLSSLLHVYTDSLLASGSDDLDIHIWNVFEKKCVASVKSGHTGNIFSVKVCCSVYIVISQSVLELLGCLLYL